MNKVHKNKMDIKWTRFPKKNKWNHSQPFLNGIFKYSYKVVFTINLLKETYHLGHVCLEPILNTNILFKYIYVLGYPGMTRSVKIQILQSLNSAQLILDESVRPCSDT